ncbi:MAG: DUF4382 domain-containing protein [Gammaproteobacteria bacterium]|nr:DUF4382 domain-containing protein [Gammaproteobacteria bacterium]
MNTTAKTALVAAVSLALAGCPNPFDQTEQSVDKAKKAIAGLNKLHTYLTNSPLAQLANYNYSEAWVTLHKVEVRNSTTNASSVLFKDDVGKSINITRRSGVAELLSLAPVPSGSYDTLIITLGNSAKIVLNDGSTLSPTFGSNPTSTYDITITLDQILNLAQDVSSGLALEFDLASFAPQGNQILDPLIRVVTNTTTFQRLYGELNGTITAIDLVGRVVAVKLSNGTVVKLQIPSFATLLDEATKAQLALAELKVGDVVQFFGNYNANQLRMEILSLLVNPQTVNQGTETQACVGANTRVRAEGYVVSYDGNTLVLDMEEASFLPNGDTLNVIGLAGATFLRGNANMLTVGQEVEVRGSWNCSNLNAEIAEIDDAPALGLSDNATELAEVKGNLTVVNGYQVTLNITSSEHFNLLSGPLAVDLTNAWFKQGNNTCLIVGANVEVKGVEIVGTPTGLQPSSVEIEGCASGTLPDDPAFDDDNGTDETDETPDSENAVEAGETN